MYAIRFLKSHQPRRSTLLIAINITIMIHLKNTFYFGYFDFGYFDFQPLLLSKLSGIQGYTVSLENTLLKEIVYNVQLCILVIFILINFYQIHLRSRFCVTVKICRPMYPILLPAGITRTSISFHTW